MRTVPILLLLAACTADVASPELRTLVEGTVPGITIAQVRAVERAGRMHYDVTGTRAGGSPVAVDVLADGNGTLRVVGIVREISWFGTPAAVKARVGGPTPTRVVERQRPDTGVTTYELSVPGRAPLRIEMTDGR